jgi:hypothetical protein
MVNIKTSKNPENVLLFQKDRTTRNITWTISNFRFRKYRLASRTIGIFRYVGKSTDYSALTGSSEAFTRLRFPQIRT